MAKAQGPEALVAGVRLSHPDRVVYPASGVTKRELAAYWEAVAPLALPHLAGRPLALVRCPRGAGAKCFYQQHAAPGLPSPPLRRVTVPEGDAATALHVAADDLAGLVALVQAGALELHPWGSTADDLDHPDRLVLDLDPAPDLPFAAVVEAALAFRDRLAALGLPSFPKTTGGKGLHLTVPLAPGQGWAEAKALARALAEAAARAEPGRHTAKAAKAERSGRIFVDYLRNERGATAVAPYSPRARPGATVATPLAWEEVTPALDPAALTVRTVPARMRARPDPWAGLEAARRALPATPP